MNEGKEEGTMQSDVDQGLGNKQELVCRVSCADANKNPTIRARDPGDVDVCNEWECQ